MKLTYFQGSPPNFGDELNATMWHHILPKGFFDEDPSTLFIGIGSVIEPKYPAEARKVVLGSGYGGYTVKPDVKDGMWDIRFVRGPQTAQVLGLDPKLAIADSAVLLRETPLPKPATNIGVAFMPHYESIERGNWQAACDLAGIRFIDPTHDTDKIISEILGADLLITEAMHGAIVADAMRTPWIGLRTIHKLHRFKWFDWAGALNIDYRPVFMFPSNCRETWALTTGRSGSGPRAKTVLGGKLASPMNFALQHMAARRLQAISKLDPQLSSDQNIERVTTRAMEAVDEFVDEYSARGSAACA
ncbi:MAG: polysaccharide pyruvyl transferase family protein [Paracoccaceae bacterium]